MDYLYIFYEKIIVKSTLVFKQPPANRTIWLFFSSVRKPEFSDFFFHPFWQIPDRHNRHPPRYIPPGKEFLHLPERQAAHNLRLTNREHKGICRAAKKSNQAPIIFIPLFFLIFRKHIPFDFLKLFRLFKLTQNQFLHQ